MEASTREAHTPNGTKGWLRLSAKSKTGFENIVKPLAGTLKPYAAKYQPTPGVNAQDHLQGS